jgi:hypothetical protein
MAVRMLEMYAWQRWPGTELTQDKGRRCRSLS